MLEKKRQIGKEPVPGNESRIDLHVHSRFSRDVGDWRLQMIGAHECYTEPEEIYRLLRRRGMDFVTLTDHDTIDGAMELAHLDRFFISEEVTTYFPEDGVKLHVVALNIDEEKHRMIRSLRENVYELTGYLDHQSIPFFIAHPLFRMTAPLRLEHFEKMLLLFKTFEVKNGGNQIYLYDLMKAVLKQLSPEQIQRLSDKHGIKPLGVRPWQKNQVGGSDDHSGHSMGSPHTVCPRSHSVQELLEHIENGKSRAAGPSGSPIQFGQNILSISYHYLQDKKEFVDPIGSPAAWEILGRLFNTPGQRRTSVIMDVLLRLYKTVPLPASVQRRLGRSNAFLEASLDALKKPENQSLIDGKNEDALRYRDLYQAVNGIFQETLKRAASRPVSRLDLETLLRVGRQLLPLVPLGIPYLIGFRAECQDRPLIRKILARFAPGRSANRKERIAVIGDESCRKMVSSGAYRHTLYPEMDRGVQTHLMGVQNGEDRGRQYRDFPVLGEMKIIGTGWRLVNPLDLGWDLCRHDLSAVYIHTLGFIGVLGLFMARWLQIPVILRYPQKEIIRILTKAKNDSHRRIAGMFFRLILRNADEIRLPSESLRSQALSLGAEASRLRVQIDSRLRVSGDYAKKERHG